MLDIIRNLVAVANKLDVMGLNKEASVVDGLIEKYAYGSEASHLLQTENDLIKAVDGARKMGAVNIKILVRSKELPEKTGGKTFINYEMQIRMPGGNKPLIMNGTLNTLDYDGLVEGMLKRQVDFQSLEDIEDPFYGAKEKNMPLAKKYPSGGSAFRPPGGEAQQKPQGGQFGIGIAYD